MTKSKRPLLRVHDGGGAGERTWLEDDELDAIPTTSSTDPNGLSRTAKAVYRQRRDGADGRRFPHSWKSRNTIAEALDVDYDTVLRADKELLAKSYLREAGLHNGRSTIYELTRGELTPQAPQSAVIEEVPPERGSLTGAETRSGVSTEAEPTPAEAGSASVKKRRRTGWRFVSNGTAGTYVRDSDGTDRLPRGYFDEPDEPRVLPGALVDELEEWNPRWLQECATESDRLWRRLNGFDETAAAAPGVCDDGCGHDGERFVIGSRAVCRSCWSRRSRASAALDMTSTLVPNEREMPLPRRVLLPAGVRV